MEISRSSKLYRWNEFAYFLLTIDTPRSLCGYFWYTVASPFVYLFSIAAFIGTGIAVVIILTIPPGMAAVYLLHLVGLISNNNETYILLSTKNHIFSWWLIVYSIVTDLIIALFFMAFHLISLKYNDFKYNHNNDNIQEKPKVIIAFEYIKAKKRKICPLIKFTD